MTVWWSIPLLLLWSEHSLYLAHSVNSCSQHWAMCCFCIALMFFLLRHSHYSRIFTVSLCATMSWINVNEVFLSLFNFKLITPCHNALYASLQQNAEHRSTCWLTCHCASVHFHIYDFHSSSSRFNGAIKTICVADLLLLKPYARRSGRKEKQHVFFLTLGHIRTLSKSVNFPTTMVPLCSDALQHSFVFCFTLLQ